MRPTWRSGRGDLDVGTLQLFRQHPGLHGQLVSGVDVQQVAATASLQAVGTRHGHPHWRGFEHLDHSTAGPTLLDLEDLGCDGFAGQGTFYEHHPTVLGTGYSGAVACRRCHHEFHSGTVIV